jgi:hypothetical protein
VTPALGTYDSQYDCVSNVKKNCAKFFPKKSIVGTFFSGGDLATGHFSGKLVFDGFPQVILVLMTRVLSFYHVRGLRKRAFTHTQTE